MEKITAVVLAAGKGTRMGESPEGSEIPKVMYQLCKKPILEYSIDNLKSAGIKKIIVVDGYKKDVIEEYFGDSLTYAFQEEQLGTGHAVMTALPFLNQNAQSVLICYGDMPLFKKETIEKLVEFFENPPAGEKPTIAMLSVNFDKPNLWSYGRIKRDENGEVVGIIEQKDCSETECEIKECNPGFYIFDANWLKKNINELKSTNVQHEYYLTDMIQIAKEQGKRIIAIPVSTESEALGINTPQQLELAKNVILGKDELLAKA